MTQSAKNCALIALVVFFWISASSASAELTRGAAVACIKQYYGIVDIAQQEGDAFVPGAAEDPSGQFVNDAALRTGIVYKIRVITCEDSPNANAFHAKQEDTLPPDFTNENYILYNKTWVSGSIGSEELSFVLGHELAHITNNHDTTRVALERVQKELEADYAGGCYVARMGGSATAMESFIRRVRATPSTNYPPMEDSLTKAKEGYDICNDRPVPPPPPMEGIDVVYFTKTRDLGKVESLLQRNKIEFSTRPGEYGAVSDTIYCTQDVPVDAIKLLAFLLNDAGIKVKSIQRHYDTNLTKRLHIESGWSGDRAKDYEPLTRSRIENLTECPDMEAQPIASNIVFRSQCSRMSPYLYVRFFDSRRNRWATEEFGRIQYEEEIALADENGERYVTDRPFYFYAESQNGTWPSQASADSEFRLSDGRTVGFRKAHHTAIRSLACNS